MSATNDVFARHTHALIGDHLPDSSLLLDVGCGHGKLAAILGRAGHTVVGIDPSSEAVEAARERGVDAREEALLDHTAEQSYDVVLFAYSLHHVEDPPAAIEHARTLLGPGGRLVVLEMAWNALGDGSKRWARAMEEMLVAAGFLEHTGRAFFAYDADHPPSAPRHREHHHDGEGHHHHHHGHVPFPGAGELRGILEAPFEIQHESTHPCIYAFSGSGIDAEHAAVCEHLRAVEGLAIEKGTVDPLGVLWVATAR